MGDNISKMELGDSEGHIQRLVQENNRLTIEITHLREEKCITDGNCERQTRTILQLIREMENLETHIERLKQESRESTALSTLQSLIQKLKQEKEEQSVELTTLREEKYRIEKDIDDQRHLIAELETLVGQSAAQPVHLEKCTEGTQTDQDDLTFSLYDPVLCNPLLHRSADILLSDIADSWTTAQIRRSPEVEPFGSSSEDVIDVFNSTCGIWGVANFQTKVNSALIEGKKMYYHGTDLRSALDILQNGIDVTKSFRNVDFSKGRGFYLTDNLERAAQWSQRVAGWRGNKAAVIAFKIDKYLRQQTHLSLKLDNDTNRKWWECIVSHFRHGETSPDVTNVLRDVKFIKGPVASNRYLGPEQIPTPYSYNFTQICICNQDYARHFGSLQNICCLIYFSPVTY